MLGRLRMRFILLSTISLLMLLVIIVVSSNLLTYRELVFDADRVLDMLAQNGGHYIKEKELPPQQPGLSVNGEKRPGSGLLEHFGPRPLSPEILYEARFFAADLSVQGEVLWVDIERIAMVDESQAVTYAAAAYSKKGARGFIGAFRYLKLSNEDGRMPAENDIHVIFLDCGRKLYTFKNALLINCMISFLGLLVIFIVIVLVSGRIVRPVSESYEKQKQFISVAGHEIRTPVTIIDADAEILAMEIGADNEWLADIGRQTRRMAALTNDLLTLSRMDENRQQFIMIDFPLSDVVAETVQSFQTLAHSKNKNICSTIAPMLSCRGDENSIRQVVGILLDNAIKYTKENSCGSCDDIMLKLEKRGHSVVLRVKNSAGPVSEVQLRQFFDRFYRTEQSGNSETGGYGLGLSIAKSIVEAHRGRIAAAAPEAGTVQITVVLPVR